MGPSKEELTNYFKNNRKYFDELANIYRQSDPKYYEDYIAPFYESQFVPISGKKSVRPAIAVFAASISVLIMGVVLFFVVNKNSPNPDVINEEDEIENEIESDNVKMLDTISKTNGLGDYEKGIMYYQLGDYDKAEKYLEKVPVSNSSYKDAKLKLIDIMKRKAGEK
jgi:tetratricopeptide (TPR) repeat protein